MHVPEGHCAEAIADNCRNNYLFTGTECIACSADNGLIYRNQQCVCNSDLYLAEAGDGTCTGCVSPLLAYDEAVGQCYCSNGASLTIADGAYSCERPCESGIFDYDHPQQCVEGCPAGKILYKNTDHVRCGDCAGYKYYSPVDGEVRCEDYFTCIKYGMEPTIVAEGDVNLRICAERAVQTNFVIDGEELTDVQGAAVFVQQDTRLYCILKDQTVRVSIKGFKGEVVKTIENVVSLGQYSGGVFILDGYGSLSILTYDGAVGTHQVMSDVAYADGAENFAVYVMRNGTFSCSSETQLCPTADLQGLVHRVVQANAEGITIQFLNGSLYYRYKGEWRVDNEAAQAGV